MAESPGTVIVLTGPAGSGKSTVGGRLAEALGWPFVEGDAFHPAENVAAMRAGRPLSDAQRRPWLEALRAEIARHLDAGGSAVIACSALKRAHRRALVRAGAEARIRFVYLRASRAMLRQRLQARRGHFFGPELLGSQLEALEPPAAGEGVTVADASHPPDALVAEIRAALAV
jgi:gluconokinase